MDKQRYQTADGEVVTAVEALGPNENGDRMVQMLSSDRPPGEKFWTLTWPELKQKVAAGEWDPIE